MKFLTLAIILMSCLVAINAQCEVRFTGILTVLHQTTFYCINKSCQGNCVLQTTPSCACSGGIGKRDFETYFHNKIAKKNSQ